MDIEIKDFPVSSAELGKLIKLVENNTVSNKQAREVFAKMIETNKSADEIVKELGLSQVSDESALEAIINEVIDANPQSVVDFKAGKDRALGFIVGQVMKKTQGKANPALASKLILECPAELGEIRKRVGDSVASASFWASEIIFWACSLAWARI